MHPESSHAPSDAAAPSLEELLAVRASDAAAVHHAAPQTGGASPAKARLLLALTGVSSDALLLAWAQRVLDGQLPHAARAEDVAEQVRLLQPQAILIEFDLHTLDTAVALATQLQAQYPEVVRVAVSRAQHPQCMLAALRAGVHDFLDIDEAIATSQQIVQGLLSRPQHTEAEPHHSPAPQLAILSARAGLGCSVLAAHLAWYLQQALAGPAGDDVLAGLLVELGGSGGSGGDCAIYLNTPGEFSFTDAVAQQRRLDRRMAQTALARHDSGLRLLPQPRQVPTLPPGEVRALMARLGQYFKHIVLDLGAHTPAPLLADLLPDASEIWVVCDQNVVSVVWTMALLSQLEALQIPRDRLRLIVNRHDSRLALDAQQIASRLQLPLLATLPERRRELADAVNHGKLLAPKQKGDPYVQAIEKLVALLVHGHHPDAPPHRTPAGPLTQLFQRIRRT
ncbi:AAA family ATPase [Comamonas serinivorans]|uniref:AAA family ATPase n=1 Tax=Comamonas serinivorans TaxID=1082851 RepID=UPI0012FCD32A|nr:pilus assembly protein CpaE [Comamonas serinivorans]